MKYRKETTINRKWRRLLSMLMTVAMLFSANAPSAVYAADGAGGVTPTTGTLGEGSKLTWTYDEAFVLTVSGGDAEGDVLNGEYSHADEKQYSAFESVIKDHEISKIVFQDCKLKGDASCLFYGLTGVLEIDCSGLDTSEVTDMREMFSECANLTRVIFGDDFKTGNVTDMSDMFSGCDKLENLSLYSFDVSNANCANMVENCMGLTYLSVPRTMGNKNIQLPNPFIDSANNRYENVSADQAGMALNRISADLQPKNVHWVEGTGKIYWEMDRDTDQYEFDLYRKRDGENEEYRISSRTGWFGKENGYYYCDCTDDILKGNCNARYRAKIRPIRNNGRGEEGLWSDFSDNYYYKIPNTKLESPAVEAGVIPELVTFSKVENADLYQYSLWSEGVEGDETDDRKIGAGNFNMSSVASYYINSSEYSWADIAQTKILLNLDSTDFISDLAKSGALEAGKKYYWKASVVSYDLDHYATSEESRSESFTYQPAPSGVDADGKYSAPLYLNWGDGWWLNFVRYGNSKIYEVELKKEGESQTIKERIRSGISGTSKVSFDRYGGLTDVIKDKGSGSYQVRVRACADESDSDGAWTDWTDPKEYKKPTESLGTTTAVWDKDRPGWVTFEPVPHAGKYEIRCYKLDENGNIKWDKEENRPIDYTSSWQTEDKCEYNFGGFISNDMSGKYMVTVTAESGDIDAYLDGAEGTASGIFDAASVEKKKYGDPFNLRWDGYMPKWELPDIPSDEKIILECYMYKEGEEKPLCELGVIDKWTDMGHPLDSYIADSGKYYFTVQFRPFGNPWYAASELVRSESLTYTKPEEALGSSTVSWNSSKPGTVNFTQVAGAYKYRVELYDGDELIASAEVGSDDTEVSFDWRLDDYGPGRFRARVRALSNNIDKLAHGPLSDFSEVYEVGDSADPDDPDTCTVTFNLQGKGENIVRYVKSGQKVANPPAPTAEGAVFGGWYGDSGCTEEWDADDFIYEDRELFAKWNPLPKYTVTFDYNGQGDKATVEKEVNEGSKLEVLAVDDVTGFTFGGWYREAACTTAWNFDTDTVTENITLYAKWTPVPTCKVTFDFQSPGENAKEPVEETVNQGAKLKNPNTADLLGFVFGGWYREAACTTAWNFDEDTVTENTTLYAKWTPVDTFKVTYDLQGHGEAIEEKTVNSGAKLTAPTTPTAEGFVFGGWYKEKECTTEWKFDTDTVTIDTTLYAKWTESAPVIVTYTVTFNLQGHGEAITPATVQAGGKVAEPVAPVAAGFVFGGWFKEAACTTAWDFANDTVAADTVLYAKWTEDKSTVTPEDVDDSSYKKEERIQLSTIGAAIGTIKPKVYDGNAYMPTVKVTATVDGKNAVLIEGIDYRVLYKDNVNAGTGKVIVKGNGIYDGEISADLVITKKPMSKLKVAAGGMGLNSTSEPPIYVYDGTRQLTLGVDYKLDGVSGLTFSAGKKDVTVSAMENGNYEGSCKTKVVVYATEKVLNDSDVTLEYTSKDYTGKALKPGVTVKFEGTELDKKFFSVKYTNNKEAGTAYVTVTGKKDYAGCVVATFEIKPVAKSFELKKPINPVTYNGKYQKPKATVTVDGKALKAGKDYLLFYSNNLHATKEGGSKAKVTVKGLGNYAGTADKSFEFTINPQKINKVSVKGTKEKLEVSYLKRALQKDIDYTVEPGEEAKGKIALTITGKGDFTGSVVKKVKVQ